MARKTFIAYKYSEAQELRDKIIEAMGESATYYKGETADSPDLTDTSTENIKRNLREMIYGTSVTIVIISSNLKASKWVNWEIEYSLKEIERQGKTSKTNGILGVIMKYDGSYDWLITKNKKDDNCTTRTVDNSKLYEIIKKNRYNEIDDKYSCDHCKSYSQLNGSYISLIDEDDFLSDVEKYIENAYEKSQNKNKYEITKVIQN